MPHYVLAEKDKTLHHNVMDPAQRRWWRLLDELPEKLGKITVWSTPQARPPRGAGHMHPNPTLMACLAGVVRVRLGDTKTSIDLHPGEVLLLAAGVWHHSESLHGDSVNFGQGFIGAWSDVGLGDRFAHWSGKLPNEPSRQLMDGALTAADDATRRQLVETLVRQVLAESVEHLAFADPAMQRMVTLLNTRFHTGLTVTELLKASGLSRSRAYAVFTAGHGMSPKEAIETFRLWLAGSLLRAGTPVAETAQRAGFGTAGTFTRAWRRAHGEAPRQAARRASPTMA